MPKVNYFFKYHYEPYDIGEFRDWHGKVVGFNGLPEAVMIDDVKYSSEVPTSEEVQMLVDVIPDFAINKDAIRVIRGYRFDTGEFGYIKNTFVLDMFYMPGMIAFGPKSYIETQFNVNMTFYGEYYYKKNIESSVKFTFDNFYNAAEYNGFKRKFTVNLSPSDDNINVYEDDNEIVVTNIQCYYDNIAVYSGFECSINTLNSYYTGTLDGQTVNLLYDYGRLWCVNYTVEGTDGTKCEFSRENEETYGTYMFEYHKPDGSQKVVRMSAEVNSHMLNYNTIKDSLSVDFIEKLSKSVSYCKVYENDIEIEMRYGKTREDFAAEREKFWEEQKARMERESELQRKKEEERKAAMKEATRIFWAKLTEEYGKDQVDAFRNGKGYIRKGIDIRLVSDYLDAFERSYTIDGKIDVATWIEHVASDSDGIGVYEVHGGNLTLGYSLKYTVYTKNYIIVDWIKY